jgi:SAM-dependent methyltransferase
MTTWQGDDYQRRFDEIAATGADVHGEATFVRRRSPRSVLDAGCGTGRVAIELARRPPGPEAEGTTGIDVVGVDVDPSMLATARALDAGGERGPLVEWHEHDLTTLDLGRTFDVVVLAGNVPLFTPPGTQRALVGSCAGHVGPDGLLIAGFQLGRGYEIDAYDGDCLAAGLWLHQRFSTWAEDPFRDGDGYAVSVHRFAPA